MSVQKSNYIKLIAMITMLIDHTGVILFPQYTIFRIAGRIAFPLFAFQLGIGYAHTRNFNKYVIRILLFGIIIQLFYLGADLILNVGDPAVFNIFFTLALGLLAIYFYDKQKYLLLLSTFLVPLLLGFFGIKNDYGVYGIFLILVMYIEKNPVRLAVVMAVLSLIFFNFSANNIQIYCLMSLLFIVCPLNFGLKLRIPQYVFYLFYPAHLVLLYLIGMII